MKENERHSQQEGDEGPLGRVLPAATPFSISHFIKYQEKAGMQRAGQSLIALKQVADSGEFFSLSGKIKRIFLEQVNSASVKMRDRNL